MKKQPKRQIMRALCACATIATSTITSSSLGQNTGQDITINTYNGITATEITQTSLDSIVDSMITDHPSAGDWKYIQNNSSINISNIFNSYGTGNLINYGVSIISPSATFTLSEINWNSTTPQSAVNGTFGELGLTYDLFGIGIYFGDDHIFGTADDVRYATGNSDTPVNAIYVLGMASTVDIEDLSVSDALEILSLTYPSTETVSYTLRGVTATTTVNFVTDSIQPIPEPSSYLMFGLGIGALLMIQNRKK